jgi:hypothetical protein
MTSVFISSNRAFYYLFSKPFRAHGTLPYDSHPQNRIPLHFLNDVNDCGNKEDQEIIIGSIRKKERKQKQKSCFNSTFNGRRDMVVGLGGISANKIPGLASSLAAPCRPCL